MESRPHPRLIDWLALLSAIIYCVFVALEAWRYPPPIVRFVWQGMFGLALLLTTLGIFVRPQRRLFRMLIAPLSILAWLVAVVFLVIEG